VEEYSLQHHFYKILKKITHLYLLNVFIIDN
jgi:hypothetical protein